MSMESDAKETSILRMLDFFPYSSKLSADQVSAYVEAVADYSAEAVGRACKQYQSGRVDGHNPSFPPNAVELAIKARDWDEAIAYVTSSRKMRELQNVTVYKAGELPAPPKTPLGPIKLEVGGFMRDVSDWTHEEKEEAMNTGKVPESVAKRAVGDAAPVTPRLRSMRDQ